MTFEEALEAWVRKYQPHLIPDDAVETRGFHVQYNEGQMSDAGTWFPADIIVKFQVRKPTQNPKKFRWYNREAWSTGDDPIEFMRELFEVSA